MDYKVSKWQSARTKPTVAGLYQTRHFWEAIFFNTEPEEHIYHVADNTWYIVHTCTMTGLREFITAPSQVMQWRGVEY
jgi:hypothetical protein